MQLMELLHIITAFHIIKTIISKIDFLLSVIKMKQAYVHFSKRKRKNIMIKKYYIYIYELIILFVDISLFL